MQGVLVVSPDDLRPDLQKTVLGRGDVELLLAPNAQAGFEAACARRPVLVIVALGGRAGAEALVGRIREDQLTRHVGVVVILPSFLPAEEEALRRAGANKVLSGRPDPFRWDEALDVLLRAPARRAVRIPVQFWVWFRFGDEEPSQGRVLNLSRHGMLLETTQPVEIGTRFEAQLKLPDGRGDLKVVGEVVRDAGAGSDQWHYGVVFRNLGDEVGSRLEAFLASDQGG